MSIDEVRQRQSFYKLGFQAAGEFALCPYAGETLAYTWWMMGFADGLSV